MAVDEEAETIEGMPYDVTIRLNGKGVGVVGPGFNLLLKHLGVDAGRMWDKGFRGTIQIRGIMYEKRNRTR